MTAHTAPAQVWVKGGGTARLRAAMYGRSSAFGGQRGEEVFLTIPPRTRARGVYNWCLPRFGSMAELEFTRGCF